MAGRSLFSCSTAVSPRALVLLAVACLAIGNCSCNKNNTGQSSREERTKTFGNLPGLRATQNQDLRDELARIEAEKATPALLSPDYAAVKPGTPEEEKSAPQWHAILPPRLSEEVDKAKRLFPTKGFIFETVQLEGARRFVKRHNKLRREGRQFILQDGFRFNMDHFHGFRREDPFRELTNLLVYIELFAAADALSQGHTGAAVGPVTAAISYVTLLSQEKSVLTRGDATFLRMGIIVATEAIVHHPNTTREDIERLYAAYANMLAEWPSDAEAWIGERAEGLYYYEWVRSGEILNVLNEEQLKEFCKDGKVHKMGDSIIKNADTDELFYLQAMRRIIHACETLPFYEREKVFNQLNKELGSFEDTPKYPIIAARILLQDIEQCQSAAAYDRAQAETWTIALALAAGQSAPDFKINPVNGEDYQVVNTGKNIIVQDGIPDAPAIIVPIPGIAPTAEEAHKPGPARPAPATPMPMPTPSPGG